MTALRRIRIGGFSVKNAVTLDGLRAGEQGVMSVDMALSHLSEYLLTDEEYSMAVHGRPFEVPEAVLDVRGLLRLKTPEGGLLAIGRISEGMVRIERMLHV